MSAAPGWVEVDAAAIAHNLRIVRQHVPRSVGLCAVVKADAYGHGIDLALPALLAEGVASIGVSSTGEAALAREVGFTGRIIRVRTALEDEIAEGIALGVEEWAGGVAHARLISRVAERHKRPIRAHVSLNSAGLSRDGLDDLEEPSGSGRRDLAEIGTLPGLDIVGICTHFPVEDADDVRGGAARFARESITAAALLGARGGRVLERHCATTHAALTVPGSWFDLVRIGAALYGDSPLAGGALRPAMRVATRIATINPYPAGRTVGYDRTHRLSGRARLAVLPVGYADGYHRGLGGSAEVLVRGVRAPVVDRLAMNSCVIDVTHIPEAAIGDEVVLYGAQGGDRITADDLAAASGQIAADLYTAWGRLLPRRTAADAESLV